MRTDPALRRSLTDRFGEEILTPEGIVDRRALGRIVFSSPSALADLNRITHARILEEVLVLISGSEKEDLAIEAVELIESGINALCTAVIGILSERELRVDRIMIRDAISKADAQRRIDAQRSDAYYREHCDICIENNGTQEQLKTAVLAAVDEIRRARLSAPEGSGNN